MNYSKSLQRRASNLLPLLGTAADSAQEEERDGDAALFAATSDVLRSLLAFGGDVDDGPIDFHEPKPGKQPAPPTASPAAEKGGHRHKFDDAGRCTVKRDGQPCPDVRKRRRGDAVSPAAPVVSGDTRTLPFKPTMTRHVRTVGGPNAGNVPECGVAMGPLDVFTGDHSAVNCIDCGRALDARRGASL